MSLKSRKRWDKEPKRTYSLWGTKFDNRGGVAWIEDGLIGVIGVLIIVLVAANVYPTMFNQTEGLETNPDISAGNQQLMGIFDTLATIAYILLPLALIFLVLTRLAFRGRRGAV